MQSISPQSAMINWLLFKEGVATLTTFPMLLQPQNSRFLTMIRPPRRPRRLDSPSRMSSLTSPNYDVDKDKRASPFPTPSVTLSPSMSGIFLPCEHDKFVFPRQLFKTDGQSNPNEERGSGASSDPERYHCSGSLSSERAFRVPNATWISISFTAYALTVCRAY